MIGNTFSVSKRFCFRVPFPSSGRLREGIVTRLTVDAKAIAFRWRKVIVWLLRMKVLAKAFVLV